MLRKRLMATLGGLVCVLIAASVIGLWLLQSVLDDLATTNFEVEKVLTNTNELGEALTLLEAELHTFDPSSLVRFEKLIIAIGEMSSQLTTHEMAPHQSELAGGGYERVATLAPIFMELASAAAHARDIRTAAVRSEEARAAAAAIRTEVATIRQMAREHVADERARITNRFRNTVVGLTVAALALANIAIFMLIRAANLVLEPVGRLVEASRRLADEDFKHRVTLDRNDEFGELAAAYNHLAAQLESNEQRKVETLRHLALTLNHELNNVINIIELQIGQLDRSRHDDPDLTARLQQIQANLERMTGVVKSLMNVRRVVLTDYVPGQKMLDLKRSTQDVDDLESSEQADQ